MRTRFIISLLVILLIVLSGTSFFWWKVQSTPLANVEPMTCIYSDTITSETAIPDWVTETTLESLQIDKEKLTPFEPLNDLTLDEQPIAWVTDQGKVVVDNELFSDLQFADVTGFSGDTVPTTLGQITETDLRDEEWRTVLEFLLKSHIIRTYVHIESELCLTQETNDDATYQAHFTAVHRYCTSECYEKPFEFTVSVDKQTKKITVK